MISVLVNIFYPSYVGTLCYYTVFSHRPHVVRKVRVHCVVFQSTFCLSNKYEKCSLKMGSQTLCVFWCSESLPALARSIGIKNFRRREEAEENLSDFTSIDFSSLFLSLFYRSKIFWERGRRKRASSFGDFPSSFFLFLEEALRRIPAIPASQGNKREGKEGRVPHNDIHFSLIYCSIITANFLLYILYSMASALMATAVTAVLSVGKDLTWVAQSCLDAWCYYGTYRAHGEKKNDWQAAMSSKVIAEEG